MKNTSDSHIKNNQNKRDWARQLQAINLEFFEREKKLLTDIQILEQDRNAVTDKLKQLDDAAQQQLQLNGDLQQSLVNVCNERDKLQGQVNQLEQNVSRIRQENILREKEDASVRESQKRGFELVVEKLQVSLLDLECQRDNLQLQVERLFQEQSLAVERLDQSYDVVQKQQQLNGDLQLSLVSVRDERDKLQGQVNKLEQNVSRIRQENTLREKEDASVRESQQRGFELIVEKLRVTLLDLERQRDNLQLQVERLLQEQSLAVGRLRQIDEVAQQQLELNGDLQQSLANVCDERDKLQGQVNQLEQNVSCIRQENILREKEEVSVRESQQRDFELVVEKLQASRLDVERQRDSRDEELRLLKELMDQKAIEHLNLQKTVVRQRDAAYSQLRLLDVDLATITSHWSWRWTHWFRPTAIHFESTHNLFLSPPSGTDYSKIQEENVTPQVTEFNNGYNTFDMNEINNLLNSTGRQFIESAFMHLLMRSPDPSGMNAYLKRLRRGVSKTEILLSIADSPEGKSKSIGLTPELTAFLVASRRNRSSFLRRGLQRFGFTLQEPLFQRLDDIEVRLDQIQVGKAHDIQHLNVIEARLDQIQTLLLKVHETTIHTKFSSPSIVESDVASETSRNQSLPLTIEALLALSSSFHRSS